MKRARGGENLVPERKTAFLNPSPYQLRKLWEHDMECASKFMNIPLRACSTVEPLNDSGVSISKDMFTHVLNGITNMWRVMSTVWEVFLDKDHPEMGYRLRVKSDLPIKFRMKESDNILVGWKAMAPEDGPSAHLYQRSILKSGEYMGGPVSFCNWTFPKFCTLKVRQVSHGSGKHLVRAETSSTMQKGQELLWDYGSREIPKFLNDTWFNPQCCFSSSKEIKQIRRQDDVYNEYCVLCGGSYRLATRDSTKRLPQKKVHFINSHVDFLGSDWDGQGEFDTKIHSISLDRALFEAERLSRLIQRLNSNGWKVQPACQVLTSQEKNSPPDVVMNTFKERCKFLRKMGCIVIRGRSSASQVEHLEPIVPSTWDSLWPVNKDKPQRRYSMPEHDRKANEETLYDGAIQDMMMILSELGDV